ncbi:MAG TPA: ComF family protein [Candidatus Sulfotelmatobacter sp.]|jgi:ComF family protein|nr:ComF family protein [Candidatus Sulfotelmatobacter sp.]
MAGPSIASASGGSWASRLSVRLAENLFTVLFPSDCRICGEPLIKVSRLPVCQECLDAMLPIAGGLCAICGERLFSSYALSGPDSEPRCGLCRRIEPTFARAAAYGSYEGGLRELIHLLKYSGIRPAANVLGRMLAEAIAELEPSFSEGSIAVIPVPLYRAKLHEREFNHAEVIARIATKLAGSGRLHLCTEALERKRETPSQTGLTRHQRRENVRGAFRVVSPESVKGHEVLVVDDVYTTGATVSECARVLRRAGATKVWVATVARTLKASEQRVEIQFSGDTVAGEERGTEEIPLARAAGS